MMLRKILILACTFFYSGLVAQVNNTFYGLARSISSTNDVYLATLNTTNGTVTTVGSTPVSQVVNLTGACLNPYSNTYHFIGLNEIVSVNLTTGALVTSATLSNPVANSFFDNFRFNNSDSTIYGLARKSIYDSSTSTTTTEIYLATINPQTGVIQQLSPSSVGQSYAMKGSAIDPYMKVYYYFEEENLVGLDMYNGAVFSSVLVQSPTGGANTFDNIAYSCVDSAIYGLIKENHTTTVFDPVTMDSVVTLDSTTLQLGKINLTNGVVSAVSPVHITQGGFAVNSGSTIDPSTMTYYFNKGDTVIGVSLITGLVTHVLPLSNSGSQFFEHMRIHSNCASVTTPVRLNNTNPAGIQTPDVSNTLNVFPNPSDAHCNLTFSSIYSSDVTIRMHNLSSQIVYEEVMKLTQGAVSIPTGSLQNGLYIVELIESNETHRAKVLVQHEY